MAMMEPNKETSSNITEPGNGSRAVTKSTTKSNLLMFDEEIAAKFMCTHCKKTFYNAIALQNHMKMQHDGAQTKYIESHHPVTARKISTENFKDLCGFKFIPLHIGSSCHDDGTNTSNGLKSRVFSEDTTFLLVKVEGLDVNMEAVKKAHQNGVKKNNTKPKPPVDLRGPFTCTFRSALRPDLQCRQIFFNCCDYSVHYREEHTKRRNAALRCQVCEKRLDNDNVNPISTLAAQFQTAKRYTFSCQPCGQTFLDSSEFDEHNRIVHAKTKPHQCNICAKRFTQQGGLQQHMRMHTGIRPFVCTFCPKAFTQKAGLDQHLRTHTKIKPFKCVICAKCFSQSVHLRQHMRTHTNIQPFECSICGRKFKQSSHLNFHMRSHIGPYNLSLLDIEKYAQAMPHQNQMEFLNLSNLQPVQDGETLYYAADLAMGPPLHQNTFSYKPQAIIPDHSNMLSL